MNIDRREFLRGQALAAEWVADFLMERELVSAAGAVAGRP